ncbi:hypothetical protein N8612_02155 [Verrucomicrobia bacterium]|nr:hypothetical protein [Verrucomicrobiota bacterium]
MNTGQYEVSEVQQVGWVQTAPVEGIYEITLDDSMLSLGNDFGNRQLEIANGSISGLKFEDINGDGIKNDDESTLEGWAIYLDLDGNGGLDSGEPSAVTDVSGSYQFDSLLDGDYTLREVPQTGWVQTFPGISEDGAHYVTIAGGSDQAGIDFGNQRELIDIGSISGVKFEDLDGDGLRGESEPLLLGWRIYIDADGDGELGADERSTLTDGNGAYQFDSLSDAEYTIRESQQSGWVQTFPSIAEDGAHVVTVVSGSDLIGVDFGNQREAVVLGSISGVKFEDLNNDGLRNENEPLLTGWTIYIDADGDGELGAGERSVVTDNGGVYRFDSLSDGDYTVREVQQLGWLQTFPNVADDGAHIVTVAGGNDSIGTDFGNRRLVTAIRIEKAINAVDPLNPSPIEDADTASGPILLVGTDVTWTYLVSNEGEVPLAIDSLVDDAGTPADSTDDFVPVYVSGDIDGDQLLDQAETWLFTSAGVSEYTVVSGLYRNEVIIDATGVSTGAATQDTDANHHQGVAASITIEKGLVTGFAGKGNNGVGNGLDPQPPGNPPINDGPGTSPGDPGNRGGADFDGSFELPELGDILDITGEIQDADDVENPVVIRKGDAITWIYAVTAESEIPLEVTEIVDDAGTPEDQFDDFSPLFIGGDLNGDHLLSVGETWFYLSYGVHNYEAIDGVQYTNIATVTGRVSGTDWSVSDDDLNSHIGGNGKGNNGVGNGVDPQPPGEPPINDDVDDSPGDPGNGKGKNK